MINGPRRYFRTCTRRRWSANNRLIALLQLHERAKGLPELLEDVHMMSFRHWDKEHGRRVKQGERAVWILAPRTRRVEEEAADGSRTSRTIVAGFSAVPVNITQTEGPDLLAIGRCKGGAIPLSRRVMARLLRVMQSLCSTGRLRRSWSCSFPEPCPVDVVVPVAEVVIHGTPLRVCGWFVGHRVVKGRRACGPRDTAVRGPSYPSSTTG